MYSSNVLQAMRNEYTGIGIDLSSVSDETLTKRIQNNLNEFKTLGFNDELSNIDELA